MHLRLPSADPFVLPLHLSDGLVLSGVELECRGCGQSYRLTRGFGRAGVAGGRVALAAQGRCPRCGTDARFLVLVDAARRRAQIQRVSRAGLWVAQQTMRLGRLLRPRLHFAPSAPSCAPGDEREVLRAQECLGQYLGEDIPAWIEVDGRRCQFVGVASRHSNGLPRLGRDEFMISPGLVYRSGVHVLA